MKADELRALQAPLNEQFGFQRIRLRFELDTGASEEQLATLQRLTERYCVVYQTPRNPPAIDVSRAASPAE